VRCERESRTARRIQFSCNEYSCSMRRRLVSGVLRSGGVQGRLQIPVVELRYRTVKSELAIVAKRLLRAIGNSSVALPLESMWPPSMSVMSAI